MKRSFHPSISSRLALFVALSLGPGLAWLIWISLAVWRDNCCPLVRPVEAGWLTSPLYNPWPMALALGLILCIYFIGTGSKKANPGRLLLSVILTLLFSWGVVNMILDATPPQTYRSQVVEKRLNKSSKAPTMYFIVAADWRAERGAYVELRIPYETFETVDVGMTVKVTTQNGFLGYEWLVGTSQ